MKKNKNTISILIFLIVLILLALLFIGSTLYTDYLIKQKEEITKIGKEQNSIEEQEKTQQEQTPINEQEEKLNNKTIATSNNVTLTKKPEQETAKKSKNEEVTPINSNKLTQLITQNQEIISNQEITPTVENSEEEKTNHTVKIENLKLGYPNGRDSTAIITGTIVNKSNKNLRYCRVRILVYDSNGMTQIPVIELENIKANSNTAFSHDTKMKDARTFEFLSTYPIFEE